MNLKMLKMALCTLSLGTSLTHAAVIEFTFDIDNWFHHFDTTTTWTLQADNNGDGVYHSSDWALSMSGANLWITGHYDESDSVEVTGDVLFSNDGIWLSGDIRVDIYQGFSELVSGYNEDHSELFTFYFLSDSYISLDFSPDSASFSWLYDQNYSIDIVGPYPSADKSGNTDSYVATFSGFEYDVEQPSDPVVAEVAEPGMLSVMGLGMIGLLGFRRRKMLKLVD